MTAAVRARYWAAPRYETPVLAAAGDQLQVAGEWQPIESAVLCDEHPTGVCTAVAVTDVAIFHFGPWSQVWLRREVR